MTLKSFLFVITFVFAVVAVSAQGSRTTLKDNVTMIAGEVVEVRDGDTLIVKAKDKNLYEIRLQGIDAPENGQPFTTEARAALSNMVLDKNVLVLIQKKDALGRYVGAVYRKGVDVGLAMISSGMAWHYKVFANEQTAKDRQAYSAAEEEARSRSIGLWAAKDAEPPWDWGKRVKTAAVVKPAQSVSSAPSGTAKREYKLGPMGGCYYLKEDGRKVYVKDKSLCGVPQASPNR
jgi:endonuclease YncB( thermonuclease family)